MLDFPILNTSRLQLRVLEEKDLPDLVRYANNRKVADRVLNIPFPYRQVDAFLRLSKVRQGFANESGFSFAIIHQAAQELVGEIGLHPLPNGTQGQIAYWIAEPYWGQGLATEAVAAILKFGFQERQLQLIFGECKLDNAGSIRVLEKNHLQAVGTGRLVEQYYIKEEHWILDSIDEMS
ncbi:MAG: GNAT family N-acetyltransferase [Bacteroidota bacterium]